MEAYFALEDFAKEQLLYSKNENDIELWKHILDINYKNGEFLRVN